MKSIVQKILFFFFILFISCKKKETIEIYLTNKRVESYEGVALKAAIKDFAILNKIKKSYGDNLRADTI